MCELYIVGEKINKLQVQPYKPVSWRPTLMTAHPDEWAATKQTCRDKLVVYLFFSSHNIYFALLLYVLSTVLRKSNFRLNVWIIFMRLFRILHGSHPPNSALWLFQVTSYCGWFWFVIKFVYILCKSQYKKKTFTCLAQKRSHIHMIQNQLYRALDNQSLVESRDSSAVRAIASH